jgi:hypothetical protein
VWELCLFIEAQCAVVNTVFIEILALWIWFSYVSWQTVFTSKDCVYCVGTNITMYSVWLDQSMTVVCMCKVYDDSFYFHICIELHYFSSRSF